MNDYVSYRRVDLERLTFAAQQHVNAELAEDFAIPAVVEAFRDHIFGGLVFQVRQEVLAQHLDRTVVRYPQDWWEMLKERLYLRFYSHWPWGIDYAKRRWPVCYHAVKMEIKALYPGLTMPEYNPVITVLRYEWRQAHD